MTPDQQLFEKTKRKGECWAVRIPDFTTPEGFFWLWERMSESQDWLHFWMFLYEKVRTNYQNQDDSSFWRIHLVGLVNSGKCLINPLKFRAALMEYWGIKEEL